jgi:hypothetical protein
MKADKEMMKLISRNFRSGVRLLVFMVIAVMITSCSKSDDPTVEPEPAVETGTVPFNVIQRVENFAVETDDTNPTEPKTSAFFSLEDKAEVPITYAKTVRWDIAFNGLYNSFLSANNGKDATNSGFGSNGAGGITIVQKSFEEVKDIPADSEFKTAGGLIGTDDAGAFGRGTGWYLYDFGASVVATGYDKQHVAYALGNPLKLYNGTTLPARTVIVKTARGNYAKIKMISCYKNAFTPDLWFRNTPHMFFTFEYILAKKGSTKFNQ